MWNIFINSTCHFKMTCQAAILLYHLCWCSFMVLVVDGLQPELVEVATNRGLNCLILSLLVISGLMVKMHPRNGRDQNLQIIIRFKIIFVCGTCTIPLMLNMQCLIYHKKLQVSLPARQLIHALLNRDPGSRLGSNSGANEIKQHSFFHGIHWPLIRCMVITL